jgi:O-antigen ligase
MSANFTEIFWYALLVLMPFLAVSPWQVMVKAPFYYGLVYYLLLGLFSAWLIIKNSTFFKTSPIKILLAVFFLINLISLLLNWGIAGDGSSIAGAVGLKSPHTYNLLLLAYLFMNILTVFVTVSVIKTKEVFEKSIKFLIYASLGAASWGIIMVLLHIAAIIPPAILPITFFPRLNGTATEPQVFGNFLLLGIFVSLAKYLADSKLLSGLVFLVLTLALIMTFSIGAWVGAGAGGLFFLIINYRCFNARNLIRLACIFIIISIFLFTLGLVYPKYSRSLVLSKLYFWKISEEAKEFKITQNPRDDKLERTWMAASAVGMFAQRPILGVGPGNYGFLYNEYLQEGVPRVDFIAKPHNLFLEILAETGITGFLIFILILGSIVFQSWRTLKRITNINEKLLVSSVACAFLGLMVHGLSFGSLAHNHAWITLGLALAVVNLYENKPVI